MPYLIEAQTHGRWNPLRMVSSRSAYTRELQAVKQNPNVERLHMVDQNGRIVRESKLN